MGGEEGREPQETQASPERFGRRERARARRPPARPGLLSPPPQAPPDSRTSTGRERPCPSWTDPRTATEARAVLPGAAAAAGPRAPSAAGGRRGANSEAPQRRGRPLSLAPPPRYLHVRRRGSMAPGPRSALRPGPRGCHGDGPLCGQGGAGARGSNGPAPDGRGGGGEREGRGGGGRGAGRPPTRAPRPPWACRVAGQVRPGSRRASRRPRLAWHHRGSAAGRTRATAKPPSALAALSEVGGRQHLLHGRHGPAPPAPPGWGMLGPSRSPEPQPQISWGKRAPAQTPLPARLQPPAAPFLRPPPPGPLGTWPAGSLRASPWGSQLWT